MIEFLGDGRALIVLAGEIDIVTVPAIRQEVTAALDAVPTELVLRMQDVTFIDSMGVGALLAARKGCEEKDVPFIVEHPSTPVMRLLQLTGLDEVIAIQPPGRQPRYPPAAGIA